MSLDATRHERLSAAFEQALALPTGERSAFLETVRLQDDEMHRELTSLLASHDEAPDWLDARAGSLLPAVLARMDAEWAGEISISSKVAHYEILERLGGRGMGLVYKARDLALDRLVALKFLPPSLSADPAAEERLKSEARAVSALDHPNIAVVHEIGASDAPGGPGRAGRLFIVMTYYAGETIKRKVARGPLPLRMALDFALQVAEGLSAAHEAGIVHRDIKPANLIVTDRRRVVIIDFGLATGATASAADGQGLAQGTVAYMSPEQTRGAPVDHRTDIWSLGVTLYEMLTGMQPFRAEGDRTMANAIRHDEAWPLQSLVPEIPAAVGEIVRRCLQKDPALRYGSGADLATALRGIPPDSGVATVSTLGRPGPVPDARSGVLGSFTSIPPEPRRQRQHLETTSSGADAAVTIPRLAVLPLANLRNDPDIDFIGHALADQIISRFSYVRGLVARRSTAVYRYQKKSVDPREVARELQVDYVLTGSYIKEAMSLRVDFELFDAAKDRRARHESLSVAYDRLLFVVDEVAQDIARKMALDVTPQEQALMKREAPVDALAYRNYLWALAQPIDTEGNLRSSVDLLGRSLELDPSFAPALSALGYRTYVLAHLGFVVGHSRIRMLHEAESSLRKALVLNPQLMSALSYLALLTLETGRIDEAAHTAERALAINPNCSDAYISLGHVYRWAGILGESERAFERATALDPYTPRLLSSGMTYLYAGKAAQALDIFTTCQPHACFSLLWQGMALLALDRIAESRKRFEAVVATSPMSTARWLAEAYLAWMGRNFVEGRTAMRALERMFAPAGEGGEALYHFGRMCTALGDSAAGIAMLQRAVDSDFVPYPYFVVDPFLDPVRAEPAFSRLLAQAEARHEAFKRSLCSQVRQPDPAAQ